MTYYWLQVLGVILLFYQFPIVNVTYRYITSFPRVCRGIYLHSVPVELLGCGAVPHGHCSWESHWCLLYWIVPSGGHELSHVRLYRLLTVMCTVIVFGSIFFLTRSISTGISASLANYTKLWRDPQRVIIWIRNVVTTIVHQWIPHSL